LGNLIELFEIILTLLYCNALIAISCKFQRFIFFGLPAS
jgi:hypothetical protein